MKLYGCQTSPRERRELDRKNVGGRPTLYGEKSIPIQIRFDKETLEMLDIICERENRSRSNLIRHIVREYGKKQSN